MARKIYIVFILLGWALFSHAQFTVTVDTTVKYQVFKGFGTAHSILKDYAFTEYSLKQEWDNFGRDNFRIAVFSDSMFITSQAQLDAGIYDFTKSEMYPAALYIKEAKKMGLNRIVMEIFSPPGWMKSGGMNLCKPYPCTFKQNYLLPEHYDDFAKWAGILVKEILKITGETEFFLSIQNEPRFEEPWTKCRYTPSMYAETMKVIGPYFQTNDTLKKVKLFGPTDMGDWGTQRPWMDTLLKIKPEAGAHLTAWGNQGYMDGVNPNIGDTNGWSKFADTIVDKYKKELWMSSGDASGWITFDNTLNFGKHVHMALHQGRVSCFHYWGSTMFFEGLYLSTKGQFAKMYYRFIPQEYQQFLVKEYEKDFLIMGFKKGKNVTITCLNDHPLNTKTFQLSASLVPFFHQYSIDPKEQVCGYKGKVRNNIYSVKPKGILTLYYNEEDTSAIYAPDSTAVTIKAVTENSVSISWSPAHKWTMKGFTKTYDVNIRPGYRMLKNYDYSKNVIVNDTNYTFTGLMPCKEYTFSVVITDSLMNVCYSTVKVKTAGTCPISEKIVSEPEFAIYPNPATSHIFIDVPESLTGREIQMIDCLGNIIVSKRLTTKEIDISGLSQGIYFIKIISDQKILEGRFIKQ